MDTTTSDLPTSFPHSNPDLRDRSTPPIQNVPTSISPSSADARAFLPANQAHSDSDSPADAGPGVMSGVVDGLRDAADRVADKVTPIVDRLKSSSSDAAELSGQWADSARTVIRGKPLVAVAGALVVGAALVHLLSVSRR